MVTLPLILSYCFCQPPHLHLHCCDTLDKQFSKSDCIYAFLFPSSYSAGFLDLGSLDTPSCFYLVIPYKATSFPAVIYVLQLFVPRYLVHEFVLNHHVSLEWHINELVLTIVQGIHSCIRVFRSSLGGTFISMSCFLSHTDCPGRRSICLCQPGNRPSSYYRSTSQRPKRAQRSMAKGNHLSK